MPYALVPDGFSLKKVTNSQKEAVDSYTNAESIQAFFDGPASGELVKGVVIVVTPIILSVLAKRGFEFAKEEADDLVSAVFNLIPEFDPLMGIKEKVKAGIETKLST